MDASTLKKSSYKHPKECSLVDFLNLTTTLKIKSFHDFDKVLGFQQPITQTVQKNS